MGAMLSDTRAGPVWRSSNLVVVGEPLLESACIAVRRLGLGVETAVRAGRTLAALVISQRGALLPRTATPDIRSLLA